MNREQIAARLMNDGFYPTQSLVGKIESIVREAITEDRKVFAAESSKDAERYRWLKAQAEAGSFGGVVSDKAIDAGMLASKVVHRER